MSTIEWTDETWNPATGCTPVSAGCDHCYARRMATRLKAMGQPHYRNGFKVTCHPEALDKPLHWRKPRMVFVCSMGDLFHEDVPFEFIAQVLDVCSYEWCERHTFQILTKRSERIPEFFAWAAEYWRGDAPFSLVMEVNGYLPNVWFGTSVENSDHLSRIDHLRQCPATVRFLSIEPMLGPMADLNLDGIDWVIVGGESGPGARPMNPDWARSVRGQCVAAGVPFFLKQLGNVWARKHGFRGKGNNMAEWPEDLRIRQMPVMAERKEAGCIKC